MKKYLFSALALCLSLVGCQKEIVSEVNPDNSVKQQKVSFVAEQSPETKTTMAIDGSTVNYSWSDEDVDFHVFYGSTPANTVTRSLAGTKMSLEVSFNENTLPTTGTVDFTGYLNGSVKDSQRMGSDGFYDPSSDVLIAKASVAAENLQSVVPFYFKRMVSVAKFTLNGLPGTPSNVTVSADKPILGSWDKTGNYTSEEGSISVAGMSNNVVFLTCAPNENVSFTITATGDGWVYSGSTSEKTLIAGNVRGMKVNMAAVYHEFFKETFNTNEGTGGNDGLWSGTIANNKPSYDNEGWIVTNGNGASKCIKLGASSKQGSAETPSFSVPDGISSCKVSFKAAAWNGNNEVLTLLLSGTNCSVSQEKVQLVKGSWSDYSAEITDIIGAPTIKFEAEVASSNRFFLDEVVIYYGEKVIDSGDTGDPGSTPEEPTIPTYASMSDLVAAGIPSAQGSKVNVTLANEVITEIVTSGIYKNGILLNIDGQQIEIYCHDVPDEWDVNGKVSGTLENCTWKLYNNSTWELCPDSWDELTYTAPSNVTYSAIYTVKSVTEVTSSGVIPAKSSSTYSSTYSTKCQLTKGNKMTLTLKGYEGCTIKGVILSMKSNTSAGAGYLSVNAGSNRIATIGSSKSGVDFNNALWNGQYSTSYSDVNVQFDTNANCVVGTGDSIVIEIGATTNSLYCQSFTIKYTK